MKNKLLIIFCVSFSTVYLYSSTVSVSDHQRLHADLVEFRKSWNGNPMSDDQRLYADLAQFRKNWNRHSMINFTINEKESFLSLPVKVSIKRRIDEDNAIQEFFWKNKEIITQIFYDLPKRENFEYVDVSIQTDQKDKDGREIGIVRRLYFTK